MTDPTPAPTPEPTFTAEELDTEARWIDTSTFDAYSVGRAARQARMLRFAARRARQTESSAAKVDAIGDLLVKRGKPILKSMADRYQVGMLLENIARLCGNPTYSKWIEDACMSQPTPDPEAR